MITMRAGSHARKLLQILSAAGEFPARSLHLLGNERTIVPLVHKLESNQDLRLDRNGSVCSTKMVQLSGKRGSRTIRLYKGALPLLNELHPSALEYYLDAFHGHTFPGNAFHIERNHRVAEALALCMMAGVEIRPYILPRLQKIKLLHVTPDTPVFYIARDFKQLDATELNKTMFTRIVGALFNSRGYYAVYNTRAAAMKWSGMGEFKAMHHLMELARMNAGLDTPPSALLLGVDADTALQTLMESDKSHRMEMRFDRIYSHVHFVPMTQDGIRLLRILVLPDWKERLLGALFPPEMRPKGYGLMEYDAYFEGKYVYSHLDSDIARLVRLHNALDNSQYAFEVLCFPWQTGFLKSYLGDRVTLKEIGMDALEESLGTT